MENENQNLEQNIVKEVSYPLFSSKGWIKFLGILLLIYGVLMAISIFGIIIAWLPIWLGILLWQAGSRIEQAQLTGDKQAFIKAQNSLSTYFTVYGVLALIGIILSVVFLIVFFTTGLFTQFQDFKPNFY